LNIQINILGISGTPIKDGNCDTLVKTALDAAATVKGVETEFITLAGKDIKTCKHCQWCVEHRSFCNVKDDAKPIIDKMIEADGLILGGPTWTLTLAPPLVQLFSRMRYNVFFGGKLRNKPVACLTVGFFAVGLDNSMNVIEDMLHPYQMFSVARAAAIASTVAKGERAAYSEHGVLDDLKGIRLAQTAAYRVVEVARMIRFARDNNVTMPAEKTKLFTAATFKGGVKKQKVFIDGVWREQS